MNKQHTFSSPAVCHQPAARGVPLALGFAAVMGSALWLLEPALALASVLAATLPAMLVLAYFVLRHLGSELRRWRQPDCRDQWLDSRTGLLAGPALAALGEPLLAQSQRRGKPLAVLVFEFDDLADVQDLYGRRARRQLLALIGRGLQRLASSKGLALRLASNRFVVLLPGCTDARALKLAAARLGSSCSFELDSPQHELVLVPRLTALCATAETDSLEALLHVRAQPVRRQERKPGSSSASMSAPNRLPAAKSEIRPTHPRGLDSSDSPATFPMSLPSVAVAGH